MFDAKLPSYNSYMKEAQISEVKNQLSRYLALVRRGEVVRILDRDRQYWRSAAAMTTPASGSASNAQSSAARTLSRSSR